MLYEFPTRTRVNINLLQTLNGDPGAGYFGATMTVADLNNDSFDDLLVSSPMLTEPKVHIFVGSRRVCFSIIPQHCHKSCVTINFI